MHSACAFAGNNRARCREKDLDIGPDRITPCVAKVESHHLVERRAAAAGHLPQPGQSRLGLQDAASVPGLVLVNFIRKWGPRTDKRHVPTQHIPELWELVEARPTKDASNRRDARVVRDFELSVLAGSPGVVAGLDE